MLSTPDRPVFESEADDSRDSPVRAARRRRLLECAEQTFVRDGYRRATMERVAEDAGVSKQTLYNYFEDKEELFASLLELRHTERVIFAIEVALRDIPDGDVEAALRSLAEALMVYGATPEIAALHRIMIELVAEMPELMVRMRTRFFYRNVAMVRAAMERGAAAGKLRDLDFEAVAYILFGTAASFGMFRPAVPDPHLERLTPERMAETLASVLARGLLPAV